MELKCDKCKLLFATKEQLDTHSCPERMMERIRKLEERTLRRMKSRVK